MKKSIIGISLIICMQFFGNVHADDLARHLFIAGLDEAQAPVYHSPSDSLVFTYENNLQRHQPRYVGVAFEHEQFSRIHEMQYFDTRNAQGELESRVYFLFLQVDREIEDLESIRYRYVIDGIWTEDPRNPESRRKLSGRKISVVQLPEQRQIRPRSPVVLEASSGRSRVVRFIYKGEPGQSIYLAGSFNNWDPFMYRLEEHPRDPGNYEIELRLLPGEYHYSYYYKGRAIQDPLNIQSSYDIDGSVYSYFSIDS
ncbi:glycogen-binding domain-containing protein [Salinispira pacifica]|nr:glycogen-binding domain-containing protein [Salinispira pacifica]